MHDSDRLAERFEEHRSRLTAVAYRLLGSSGEADDAVQEAWLRLSRSDPSAIVNLRAWLTTVVSRVCLNMLQARRSRREVPLGPGAPEPAAGPATGPTPSTKSCSPTRSDRRCWSCSTRWHPRSASPSSCTTCSPCRSTTSRRSPAAVRSASAAALSAVSSTHGRSSVNQASRADDSAAPAPAAAGPTQPATRGRCSYVPASSPVEPSELVNARRTGAPVPGRSSRSSPA